MARCYQADSCSTSTDHGILYRTYRALTRTGPQGGYYMHPQAEVSTRDVMNCKMITFVETYMQFLYRYACVYF